MGSNPADASIFRPSAGPPGSGLDDVALERADGAKQLLPLGGSDLELVECVGQVLHALVPLGDVHALLKVRILQKTKEGHIVFPFDAVHVNFFLKTA